jgi:hypothetical protein
MPPEAVDLAFREVFRVSQGTLLPTRYNPLLDRQLKQLADMFSAAKKAMSIRLKDLGLMDGFPQNIQYR